MSRVFFSYFLRDAASAEEFERQILRDVAPDALAHQTVQGWTLHRTMPWAGGSFASPDYVCVVDVTDVRRWSEEASDSIVVTHGGLGPLVKKIDMAVTDEVVAERIDGH